MKLLLIINIHLANESTSQCGIPAYRDEKQKKKRKKKGCKDKGMHGMWFLLQQKKTYEKMSKNDWFCSSSYLFLVDNVTNAFCYYSKTSIK